MIPRSSGRYALKISKPGGAAKLPATASNPSQATRLLAQAYLPHFYPYPEFRCQHFDQLPKIYPVVSRVVKGCFRTICLVLHIGELHFQFLIHDDLPGSVHRIHFPGLYFFKFAEILGCGYTVNSPDVIVVIDVLFLHLKAYQLPLQGNIAYVVAIGHIYYHGITCVECKLLCISEKLLPAVLKSYFYDVKLLTQRVVHVRKPVKYVQFVTPVCAAGTVIFTARRAFIFLCRFASAASRHIFKSFKI